MMFSYHYRKTQKQKTKQRLIRIRPSSSNKQGRFVRDYFITHNGRQRTFLKWKHRFGTYRPTFSIPKKFTENSDEKNVDIMVPNYRYAYSLISAES